MVFDKVKEILAELLYWDEDEMEEVSLNTRFAEFGMDSIDVADFLIACEDQFDVMIGDEGVESFVTVKDLVEFIQASI